MWSPYKLRSWVKLDKLNWNGLSENPKAMKLLLENPEKINWSSLCRNERAIGLLEKNPEKIDWFNLCQNPSAMTLLKRNKHKIHLQALTINTNPEVLEIINYFKKNKIIPNLLDSNVNFDKWDEKEHNNIDKLLCSNINAIDLIKKNVKENNNNKLCWYRISRNENAMSIINKNKDKICWPWLCGNKNAMPILRDNLDKLHWSILCGNVNAMELLEENEDKIYWKVLSKNPAAIYKLEQNQEKINWEYLSRNPEIFELDYKIIAERMKIIEEDLMKKCWHPNRITYHITKYNYDLNYDEYIEDEDEDDLLYA